MSCRLEKRYMGGSTSFNGTSSKIQIASLPLLANITTDYAVFGRFWVSGVKPSTVNEMVSCRGGENHFLIRYNTDGKLNYYDWTGGAPSLSTIKALSVGWHSFVAFRNGVNMTLYLDGVVQSTRPDLSGSITWTNTEVMLGANSPGTGAWFKGKQAEVGFAINANMDATKVHNYHVYGELPEGTEHFFPLSDLPSTYLDTVGGATGTGTATTYSPDVPVQLPVVVNEEARSSLSFDGVDDKVTFTPITVPVYTGSATLDIYLKRLGAGDMCLFGYDQTAYKFLTWYAGGGIVLETNTNNDAATASSGYALLNPDFHRITCVSTLGVVKMFFDGQRIPMSDSSVSNDVTIDRIGLALTGFPLKALVKSARIWNTALTDQQIRDLHFSNIVPYKDDPTKLVLNLKLNEGAGTIAYDSSGNGNDGTITGATWSADVPSKAREVIGGNLVKNGSFEYVPRVNVATTTSLRWIDGTAGGSTTNDLFKWHYVNDAGTTSAQFDSTEKYSGGFSIKIDATDASGRGRVIYGSTNGTSASLSASMLKQYAIPVKPNTSYTLSYWAKSLNLAGNGRISVHQHTGGGTRLGITQPAGNLTGTNDWTLLSGQFTTQATAKYLVFSCEIATAGIQTLWFSDISLTETTLPTRTATTTRTTLTCP